MFAVKCIGVCCWGIQCVFVSVVVRTIGDVCSEIVTVFIQWWIAEEVREVVTECAGRAVGLGWRGAAQRT